MRKKLEDKFKDAMDRQRSDQKDITNKIITIKN